MIFPTSLSEQLRNSRFTTTSARGVYLFRSCDTEMSKVLNLDDGGWRYNDFIMECWLLHILIFMYNNSNLHSKNHSDRLFLVDLLKDFTTLFISLKHIKVP